MSLRDLTLEKLANTGITIETADIEIGAVEIKDGTTDARQAVKVDNATAGATPTIALTGGIYKASLDTYADNDASPLHTDINGQLLVSSSGTVDATITGRTTYSATIIDAVTLDDSPTETTSASIDIRQYKRVGFMWTYDETEVGNAVSGTLTIEISPDNTNWFSAPFFDTAGGATPQTSEALSDDGSYVCWLDPALPFGYVRVTIAGTNTDADDTILTSVFIYADM